MMVEAWLERGQRARLEQRRAITERFPTYWPAWFDLGDQLTHHGVFLGIPLEQAVSALERTVALNPRFVPAWEHLHWIAVHARDTVSSGRTLARLTELRVDSLLQDEWDLRTLDYYSYLDQLARMGGEPRDTYAAIGARVLVDYTGPLEPERLATSLSNHGFHRAQLDMAARVRALGPNSATLAAQTWAEALAWAGRGAWDSAHAALGQYARVTPNPRGPLWAFGLATAGAWLGVLDADAILPLRDVALRSVTGGTPDGQAEIAWLDGLLACTRADAAGMRDARTRLDAVDAPGAPALRRSLAAFDRALHGGSTEAGRALADLEWANADSAWAFSFGSRHPYLPSLQRLAAARWLLADGDTAQAARLLLLFESDLPGSLHPLPTANIVLGAFGLPDLARIEDARGRLDMATYYRARFRERADLVPHDGADLLAGCGARAPDRG
jgi:hypothetical protein